MPAPVPYLGVLPDRVAKWRARLGGAALAARGGGMGGQHHPHQQPQSLDRAGQVRHLFPDLDIEFVSIQKELGGGDAATLSRHANVMSIGEELCDFADTAAVISLLDLVVAVDTSVVHLAGALARPVWVLVPFSPDFRWLLAREDSPWYPTMRLFRQPGFGEWDACWSACAASSIVAASIGGR